MSKEKAKKIRKGDIRTATRLIRNIENNVPGAKSTIKHLFPFTGKAHVIGLTGSPGAGKSTVGVVLAKSLGMQFIDTVVAAGYNDDVKWVKFGTT